MTMRCEMHAATRKSKDSNGFWFGRHCVLLVLLLLAICTIYAFGPGLNPEQPSYGRHNKRAADPKPPQPPLVFGKDTVESLQKLLDKLVADEKATVETIIKNSATPKDATFNNTIKPYADHENDSILVLHGLNAYSSISPDAGLRNFSSVSAIPLDERYEKTMGNRDLFARVDFVYQQQKKQPDPKLSAEDRLFLERFWRSFANNGLNLPDGELKRFQDISKNITKLTSEFGDTVNAINTTLYFTKDELDGTPLETLNGLPKGTGENQGKFGLGMASPDYGAVISHAKNETVRRLITYTSSQTAPSNLEVIQKLITLRDEMARLLNYSSFAELAVRDEMAKTPKAVEKLLADVKKPMLEKLPKEIQHIKDWKKNETGNADHLYLWDDYYYTSRIYEDEYKLDVDYLKEWFPADYMFERLLEMYEQIYALNFIAITGKDLDDLSPTKNGSDLFWAPDVTLYAVWDDADDTKGDFIGYLYVDLYYREAKAPGAFMMPFVAGFENPDGSRTYPSVGLFCNFKKSDSNTAKPQLIKRSEIQTILHEAGHCMHGLTSKVKYGRFHGTNTPRDWVEMPSQLMENWSYIPAVLKRLSKHWSYLSPEALKAWQKERTDAKKDTKQPEEKFPDDLIKQLILSKNAFTASYMLGQAFFSAYDYILHDPKSREDLQKIDQTVAYNKGYKDYSGRDGPEVLDPNIPGNKEVGAGKGFAWGHGQTTFTHIMSGGYEGRYYSYTWALINAKDVFYTAFKKDPFSREVGAKWRKTVLEPGATKDYDKILEEFLGRPPNSTAFLRDLGVDV
ncbi:uncharacterized protein MYCFIDRAFT_56517 [Pseudocercospora fijiensis CIRAD86]|uniref:Peptidase M3A/M3B catalytic domain-containing protein n=1 Tax=Pseudocercospora fijiensis (strain CIRAD86) TaxID=383855 RepID=M2YW31_PSEFD|nr:uncharacterized protein MYCFIDRAFT_56517 [Pseudocercospora fijiensis CIRAD86]EME81925.1 hypothetical protein MYCFIDRAFT_56517 [Pseudocercospora fijiensis CIRAD86]